MINTKPWKCTKCTKCTKCARSFASADGLHSHCKAKHNRAGMSTEAKAARAEKQGEYETFADRAIQAQLDHATGIDNPDYDWLVEPWKRGNVMT